MNTIKFRKWGRHTDGNLDIVAWTILNASNSVDFRCDESEAFMQYTGLKDKNGVEIYEGDIIKEEHSTSYVNFFEGRFFLTHLSGNYVMQNSQYYEIIGNIYQNPELLTPTI